MSEATTSTHSSSLAIIELGQTKLRTNQLISPASITLEIPGILDYSVTTAKAG